MEVEMFLRFRVVLGFALLLSLIFVIPAFAGGWAVITLDELPTNISAGEPHTIGFTVLQHGRTPMTDIAPTVTAELSFDEKFVVQAEPEGKPGHYTAVLTFPKEGNWEWSIQAFTMDQPMPALRVTASGMVSEPVKTTEAKPATIPWLMIIRMLAFGVALASLIVAFQRRSRLAGALTGLCLLIGIGSFMPGATALEVEAQSKPASKAPMASSVSQIELGEQLFIAKGCITCHVNNKVDQASTYVTIEMGATNLTKFKSSPEALRLRLKDPAAVKSDTKMPNLGLKETEIEALIAFINSE
jgi:cytochrome c2